MPEEDDQSASTPYERELLASRGGSRGYVPTGPDTEPDQAPDGPAGPSHDPAEGSSS